MYLIVMMQSLMACNNGVDYDLMFYYEEYLTEPYVLVCWTIQLQEWIESNGGSSLLDSLYKALDEVSLIYRIFCKSYKEAIL